MNNYLLSLFGLYLGAIFGNIAAMFSINGIYSNRKWYQIVGWGLIWPVVFYKMYWKKNWVR